MSWSGRRLILFSAILLALATAVPAVSEPGKLVVLVKSRRLTPYNQAEEGIRRTLAQQAGSPLVRTLDLPGEPGREAAFFQSLERLHPDVIVTIGTQATLSVTRRVRDVPVVFSLVLITGDSDFLLRNRPPNVTGAAMDIPVGLQFSRLKEMIPNLKRVGVIFNPAVSRDAVTQAGEVAEASGLSLVQIPVESEDQVLQEIGTLKGRVDALWSVADSTVFTPRSVDSILLLTLRDGIPFVGLSPSFVKAGALLSFSCDYGDVGAQAAEQAEEILSGASPGKMAISYPRKVSLYLNLNTARAIHLEVSEKIQSESQVEFAR